MAKLEVQYPDGLIETKELTRDRSFQIGSDPASDLRLEGDLIQPKHCVIRWVDRRYRLDVDQNAKNVFVGVNPVTNLRLKPNQEFSIGDVEFRVRYEPDEIGTVIAPIDEASVNEAAIRIPLYRSRTFLGVVAALVVLAAAGGGLYFLVQARAAERMLDAARRDLNDRLYSKAIIGFDRFLDKYPGDERASEARYLRAKCRVEQFVDASAPSWNNAYEAARKMVEEAGDTPSFRQHPTEIGVVFVGIARGLAVQARDRSDPAPLELSSKMLELLSNSISKEALPTDEINRVHSVQEEARIAVAKESSMAEALAAMDKSLNADKPADLYRDYVALTHRYAEAKADPRVKKLLQLAAEKQKGLVTFDPPGAGRSAGPLVASPSLTRYTRSMTGSPANGPIVPVQVADVLYGVDSGTGEIRWRTVVGYPTAFPPVYPSVPTTWIVAYRSSANELLLLDAADGQTLSRLALTGLRPRSGCEAVATDDHVYVVATKDEDPVGIVLVLRIGAEGLIEEGRFTFPQPIVTPPVVDVKRQSLLVVGEQAVMYQVGLGSHGCERVVSLAHEAGAIRTKPAMAGRFLLLAESLRVESSQLRCFVVGESDGAVAEKPSLPLKGVVEQAPIVKMGRVFVATSQGQYSVAELGAETDARPLAKGAEYSDLDANQDQPHILLVTSDTEMWVLGSTARKFQVRVDQGSITAERDVPLGGLATSQSTWVENQVVAVADDREKGGVRVVLIDPKTITAVAVALLGRLPLALAAVEGEGGQLVLVDPERIHRFRSPELSKDAIVQTPVPPAGTPLLTSRRWEILEAQAEGITAFTDSSLIYVPSRPDGPSDANVVRSWNVPGGCGGMPAICGDGVLLPARSGFVYWVNAREQKELADPFAAPLVGGSPLAFSAVAAGNPRDSSAGALASAGSKLFKLELIGSPSPAWRSNSQADIEGSPVISFAILGKGIWCIRKEDVVCIEHESMKTNGTIPFAVGRHRPALTAKSILVSNRIGKLACMGMTTGGVPGILWEVTLSAEPTGPAIVRGDSVWVTLPDGVAIEFDLASGKESRRLAFGRALAEGPFLVGEALVAVAADGSLCRLPLP